MNCRNRNSLRRGEREYAGPRNRRDVPPGSLGEPAIFAGIRERASGRGPAPRRPGTAVYLGPHAEWHFGELRIPPIFGDCREARARVSVRAERTARQRSARAIDGISFG